MKAFNVRRATRPRAHLAGPLRLAARLAARDLRQRPGTGLLLFVALVAASTTFTLALVVRGSAEKPWDHTFALTAGPHIVATTFDADAESDEAMSDLAAAPGVTARAGPYQVPAMGEGSLEANGRRIGVEVMARDITPAAVDQPALTDGRWIRDGGVVVEASFASALRVRVGDKLTIAGRPFEVAGVAVTTSRQPTPFYSHGVVWATHGDAERLAPGGQHPRQGADAAAGGCRAGTRVRCRPRRRPRPTPCRRLAVHSTRRAHRRSVRSFSA